MSKSSLLTFLFNACWQVALIASFATLGSLLLRRTSVRYRHWLWMSALVLALFVPLLTSSQVLIERLLTKDVAVQTFQPGPFIEAPALSALTQTSDSWLSLDSRLALAVIIAYSAFVLFRLARLVQAWLVTRRLRASAFPVELSPLVTEVILRCRSVLNVRRAVEILSSTQVHVPVTIGLRRPVIILPEELLAEENVELLTSAIGHELVHVERRDYLLNLLCELLFVPVSFNPFAALLRRRIKQTRELSCDELVAERILNAEVYARSLVRLVSSVPALRQLPVTTTVGIADADILEARIMSLLNRPKVQTRWKTVLLVGVSLLLLVPCAVAASFGGRYEVSTRDEVVQQDPKEQEVKEVEKMKEAGVKVREMSPVVREEVARKRRFEMEMVTVKQAALFSLARLSMDQAIQIATSQTPGKVMQATLDVDKWEEPGKIAKDGKIFYRVVVVSTDGDKTIATHVWVNAIDGTIIKTEKELPRWVTEVRAQ